MAAVASLKDLQLKTSAGSAVLSVSKKIEQIANKRTLVQKKLETAQLMAAIITNNTEMESSWKNVEVRKTAL